MLFNTTLCLPAAAAKKTRPRYPTWWLASLLLTTGLGGCGQATEPVASSAPPPAASLAATPVVATSVVATAAAAPAPAEQVATKPLPKPKAVSKPVLPVSTPAAAAVPVAAAPTPPPATEAPAPAPAAPTTRTQTGRVLDEAGQPLVGATVLLKGSTKGTSTDANGSYSFEVPAGENTFIFGYGGYEDEITKGHDGQPLTVTLLPTPGQNKLRKKRR